MNSTEIDMLTERIIGCGHQVSNSLGIGFVEKVYENAHVHEMRKDGLIVIQQYPVKVVYDALVVGEFFVDTLVEDRVLVELKPVSALSTDHLVQALNYLRAIGLPACLLKNFGQPRLQIRRLYPSPSWKSTKAWFLSIHPVYLRSSLVNDV